MGVEKTAATGKYPDWLVAFADELVLVFNHRSTSLVKLAEIGAAVIIEGIISDRLGDIQGLLRKARNKRNRQAPPVEQEPSRLGTPSPGVSSRRRLLAFAASQPDKPAHLAELGMEASVASVFTPFRVGRHLAWNW